VVGDLERRLAELRFVDGIEKVEHVPYPTGDQFWVRFNRPLDIGKLEDIVKKHNCLMVRFANLRSKLPRGLAEMLSDGVTHVIAKKMSGWSRFTSSLGFEPGGIAKIANDMHGHYQIFMATEEEGVQLLYEYLGLKYVPPAPPKSDAPTKPLRLLLQSQLQPCHAPRHRSALLRFSLRLPVNPSLFNRRLASLQQYPNLRTQRQRSPRKRQLLKRPAKTSKSKETSIPFPRARLPTHVTDRHAAPNTEPDPIGRITPPNQNRVFRYSLNKIGHFQEIMLQCLLVPTRYSRRRPMCLAAGLPG
jgi:hypothetical protein